MSGYAIRLDKAPASYDCVFATTSGLRGVITATDTPQLIADVR
jgi:hypothetical protein